MIINGIMMQYFEWDMASGILWKQMKQSVESLSNEGITSLWIPPPYKGMAGKEDQGYSVYDHYDLGEFNQKGTIETKYGSKNDLILAIEAAHQYGIEVYADIVLDHKMGADGTEIVQAEEYNATNRLEKESDLKEIKVATHFTFPGRHGKYSDFEWHWYHFTGIDFDEREDKSALFKFAGKCWEKQVDLENGNYDYLMGASIDLSNQEVQEELTRWGKWFIQETGVDGFRIDAVKHMRFSFYDEWLHIMRSTFNREFFSVGEYWQSDIAALRNYIDTTKGALCLFDVPLHFNFYEAANAGAGYDMRTVFDGTLTQENPLMSVTFVDNHDTQPDQSLASWIEPWFKPLAYAMILLRQEGYPCIFYGDYYGLPHHNIEPARDMLLPLMKARTHYAHGKQNDYFDHNNIIGWTREGTEDHEDSGIAVLLSNAGEGEKLMYVGKHQAGFEFYDITGNQRNTVVIKKDGNAVFKVNAGSVSVWVKKTDRTRSTPS